MPPHVEIVALSPLKSAALVWRPKSDKAVLTVVCKATYAIEPGESPLAEVQDDVNERDLHAMNNEALGLHSASDLVPFKPRADVTLVGKAYSPPGELARSVIARLKVGSVDKRVSIHADRFLRRSGRIEDDKFFSKMALGYENAPGGKGTDNPAGIGFDGERDGKGRLALPNLQHPDEQLSGPATKLTPIGFGPLPSSWPPRRRALTDHHDGPWLRGDYEQSELPEGWNWAFCNVAPRDQQLEEIAPDQTIVLEHLHPEEAKLKTQLPGLRPVVYAERSGGAQRLELRGDTLWIDTNRLVQTLTWRGALPLDSFDEEVRLIVTMAKPGEELDWDAAWRLAEAKQSFDDEEEEEEEDNRKTIARPARTRIDSPNGPVSGRPQTSPVPLVPNSDHTPGWMPQPAGSNPGAGPLSSRGPVSRQGPMSSDGPISSRGGMSMGPMSSPSSNPAASGPMSSASPPASNLTVELSLTQEETEMLRALCKAMGYDAVDMIKYALREAHQARFGS